MQQSIKKREKSRRNFKLRFLIASFLGTKNKHNFLRKHDVFGYIGKNVLFQPRYLPNETKQVKLHDNVKVAADVTFYTHDAINMMFAAKDGEPYHPHTSCIEIHENCFIGGHSILVGDISIGPNSIVAAGSVVVKDVPQGVIVGGNPAKVIGSFESLHEKRQSEKAAMGEMPSVEQLWDRFYSRK